MKHIKPFNKNKLCQGAALRRANVTCRIAAAKWIDNLATVDTGGGGVGSVSEEEVKAYRILALVCFC